MSVKVSANRFSSRKSSATSSGQLRWKLRYLPCPPWFSTGLRGGCQILRSYSYRGMILVTAQAPGTMLLSKCQNDTQRAGYTSHKTPNQFHNTRRIHGDSVLPQPWKKQVTHHHPCKTKEAKKPVLADGGEAPTGPSSRTAALPGNQRRDRIATRQIHASVCLCSARCSIEADARNRKICTHTHT